MDNEILENKPTFNILQYLKENLVGILLLTLALFIIYFVDYVNQLNNLFYSNTNSVVISPGKLSKRKLKKH
jgi:uncharacterized membrane protein YcaP (DUF421 family)